jgi:TPR repeat protein
MKTPAILLTALIILDATGVRAQTAGTNDPSLETGDSISNRWSAQPLERLRQAAEGGDLSAEYFYGRALVPGYNPTAANLDSIHWINKAADSGLAAAQNYLGWMYQNGLGIPADKDKAISWYKKAADRGFIKSELNLGWFYAQGPLTERDYDLAESWCRKAALTGSADAQYSFGRLLTQEFDRNGVWRPNFEEAREWYLKAANQNQAKAQYELAQLYNTGELGDDKRTNCIPWFFKAAANGNTDAQAEIGQLPIYYPNNPLLKSINPVEFLEQSAKAGNLNAQFELGNRYRYGKGVPVNATRAAAWLEKAAMNTTESSSLVGDASYELAEMLDKGEGVPQDSHRAFVIFQMLAGWGWSNAKPGLQFYLGQLYESGRGGEQSDTLAVSNYLDVARHFPRTTVADAPAYAMPTQFALKDLTSDFGSQAAERLADLYSQGRGLPPDGMIDGQFASLTNAAATAHGIYLLGEMAYEGKVVKQDYGQAAQLFNRAADLGSPEAMNRIGDMWAAGLNGAPDANEAAAWHRKAAEVALHPAK